MPAIAALVDAAHAGALLAKSELRREAQRILSGVDADRSELEDFLRAATPRDWITFDESMRAFWYGEDPAAKPPWWQRAWRALEAGEARPSDILAIGLASMDRDGRVREAAVRQLAAERDSIVGPFLALRTTDWVDEVATVAVTILAQRMASDAAVVVSSAPLVFALSSRQRRSHIERVVLERAAANTDVRTALSASSDRWTRRRIWGDEAVREASTLDELIRVALSDADTVVASAVGVEAVSRIEPNDSTIDVLDALLGGPALVRSAVLRALADRAEGPGIPEGYLFDRSPAVRAAAQYAHRRWNGDPAVVYRAALGRSEHVPIAVTELARVGSAEDRERIMRALYSADVATRRAAVGAVRWVAGERLMELVSPLLWDPSPGVTRAAEKRLWGIARDLDGRVLLELTAAPLSHNRRAAYRLMRRRSASERIEADLLAVANENEDLSRTAVADLRSWLRRGAASAPRGDLPTRRRLRKLLAAVEHLLRRDDVAGIKFHAGLRSQDLEG